MFKVRMNFRVSRQLKFVSELNGLSGTLSTILD
jgi:hypothetical protein